MAAPVLKPALRIATAWCVLAATGCALFGSPVYIADTDDPAIPDGTPLTVAFEGADSIAEFRLRRALEDRIIDLSRTPDSAATLQDAIFDLEDRYRNDGFADVIASGSVGPADPSGQRTVTFEVREGPQWFVRDMNLVNIERLDPDIDHDEVTGLWLRRYADTFGFAEPVYVSNDLRGYAASIQLFLQTRGYLDATVDEPLETRDESVSAVDVTIRLDPGTRYRFGLVEPGAAIAAALPAPERPRPPASGAPANAADIEDYRSSVLRALRHRGHAEATVRARLERQIESRQIHVTVDGEPGARTRIVAVDIEGLERTRPFVVENRLAFKPGELFDGDAIDESLRELYRTGLFQRVEIDHRFVGDEVRGGDATERASVSDPDPDADPAIRDARMLVAVDERPSRSLEVLAGYGSYELARGKIRFEENNVFGSGRALLLEARGSTRGERGLAQITDPFFFGSRNSLSIGLDAYRRQWPTFNDEAWGGTIAVTRNLFDRVTTRVGYTLRLHTNAEDRVANQSTDIGSYVEGAVFLDARIDGRDSILYPRDGYQVSFRVDRNDDSLGADIEFLRAQISTSYYVPLTRRASLALRADIGGIWPERSDSLVPLQERFFNGGENTVRSFREFQLGPRDIDGRPLGGQFRNLFAVELRTQITRLIETGFFVDAGNIGVSIDDYSFDDLRFGIGTGLRIALPIGPVRADAAWNPDRQPGEREWTIHLSVGYPF